MVMSIGRWQWISKTRRLQLRLTVDRTCSSSRTYPRHPSSTVIPNQNSVTSIEPMPQVKSRFGRSIWKTPQQRTVTSSLLWSLLLHRFLSQICHQPGRSPMVMFGLMPWQICTRYRKCSIRYVDILIDAGSRKEACLDPTKQDYQADSFLPFDDHGSHRLRNG